MSALPAPGFTPNFNSTHSVVLDHPIETVYSIIGTPQGCERVTRLSSLCSHFELKELDSISIPKSLVLSESSVRKVTHLQEGQNESDEYRSLPRQHFIMSECVPLIGPLKKHVDIQGTLTWDEQAKTALYESIAGSISVWKLREFREEEGGTKTRVSEWLQGSCPALLQFIVSKIAGQNLKDHMESYHTLFETSSNDN